MGNQKQSVAEGRKMNISILLSCVLLGGGVASQDTTIDSDIVDTTETINLPDIAHTTVKEAFDDYTEGTTINTEEPLDAESDDCESHILQSAYSDHESFCNMYQACLKDANGNYKKFSFLCPSGSNFNPEKEMCDIRFQVDCGDKAEREGKNMFSFAIKSMFIGDSNIQDENEEGQKIIKMNPKKSRQLLPRLK